MGAYKHRIGRTESPECQHCEGEIEDVEHLLMKGPAWDRQRLEILGFHPQLEMLNTDPAKVVMFLRRIRRNFVSE